MKKTTAYTVTKIPVKLWTRVRIRAIQDGLSIRELILKVLEEYLGKEG